MVDVPLSSVSSVTDRGSGGNRSYGGKQERRPATPGRLPVVAQDEVRLHAGRGIALQVLRERVLAATRSQLELDVAPAPRLSAAEAMPTVGDFLSRLLSEQNQVARLRAGAWEATRIRRAIVEALQGGAAETLDLLEHSGRFEPESVQVIVEVLAEFGQRLSAFTSAGDGSR